MYTVDLNSDLGESFGNYKIGNDDKIIPLISSANVACGYHASDPVVMGNTLAMAKEAGIRIGAHPGFPDHCLNLLYTFILPLFYLSSFDFQHIFYKSRICLSVAEYLILHNLILEIKG